MKKQKKPFITRVRMFMAAGSFVGLVGGWALLAQTDAPASAAHSTAIVEMAPAQSTDFVTIAPAAGNTSVATTTATKAASTPAPTATATKATATTTLPMLRTRSS